MRTQQRGFTMTELIVVVSIVGILMAVGAPSYRYVTTANRISSEVNGLLGDLQFARAEAIKQGQTVTACASVNGTSCAAGATDWRVGWIVFSDTGAIGTVNGTDAVLHMQRGFTSTDTFGSNPAVNAITFNREGFAQGLGAADTLTLHDSTAARGYTRCLQITIVGSLATQVYDGATCR